MPRPFKQKLVIRTMQTNIRKFNLVNQTKQNKPYKIDQRDQTFETKAGTCDI